MFTRWFKKYSTLLYKKIKLVASRIYFNVIWHYAECIMIRTFMTNCMIMSTYLIETNVHFIRPIPWNYIIFHCFPKNTAVFGAVFGATQFVFYYWLHHFFWPAALHTFFFLWFFCLLKYFYWAEFTQPLGILRLNPAWSPKLRIYRLVGEGEVRWAMGQGEPHTIFSILFLMQSHFLFHE